MANRHLVVRSLVATFALSLVACGGDEPAPAEPEGEGLGLEDFSAAPPAAVIIASETNCRVHSDCASGLFCFQNECVSECSDDSDCSGTQLCSERGRCTVQSATKDLTGEPSAETETPEYEVVAISDPNVLVAAPSGGEPAAPVFVEIELNQSPPEEGLLYIVRRSDEERSSRRTRRARATEEGSTTVRIELDAGAADPSSQDPVPVQVDIVGSFDNVEFVLVPERSVQGVYAGTVFYPALNARLPIELAIFEGDDGLMAALPLGPEHPFSPRDRFDEVAWSVRPLRGDLERGFDTAFDEEFVLPNESIFAGIQASTGPGQIGRAIQLELEYDDGRVYGEISDRWVGLTERYNADGQTIGADVLLEGEISLERAALVSSYDGPLEPNPGFPAEPRTLPAPPLDACDGLTFPEIPGCAVGGERITDRSDFEGADPVEAAECAIAIADVALNPVEGELTTSQRLNAYLADEDTGELSFEDFMATCASGEDGLCRPSELTLCARQLSAFSIRDTADSPDAFDDLSAAYQETTRESLLGRQLGAFYTDNATRLEWLSASGYPAIVTSAVRGLVADLLSSWQTEVLDVHIEVLGSQLDPAGLAVLALDPRTEAAQSMRRQLLTDITQGWRGTMESLTTGAARWNDLLEADDARAERSSFVTTRTLDLYLSAALLSELNRAAGSGYLNAGFGTGFGALGREMRQLSLPFNQLVYARDAEVAVAASVDPLDTNDTLLSDLEAEALAEIADAAEAVNTVLELEQAEALSESQLRNRMNNEIDDLRRELIDMCGLPENCTAGDLEDSGACHVGVSAGVCGFTYTFEDDLDCQPLPGLDGADADARICGFNPENIAISEAGGALLEILRAAAARNDALSAEQEFREELELRDVATQAIADELAAYPERIAALDAEFEQAIGVLANSLSEEQAVIAENFHLERGRLLEEYIEDTQVVAQWNRIRVGGLNEDMHSVRTISAFNRMADSTASAAEFGRDMAEAAAAAAPTAVGTSTDPSGPIRFATLMSSAGVQLGARAAEQGMRAIADGVRDGLEDTRLHREAELELLRDLEGLDTVLIQSDLTVFEEAIAEAAVTGAVEREAAILVVERARARVEADMQYHQLRLQLEDNRIALLSATGDLNALQAQATQAEFQLLQRLFEYRRMVQRAELLDAKLGDLVAQRSDINSIIGSPNAFFGRANRILQAENRLERSKAALMEWLVALEYFAVRPFIDQRVQVLLARNTFQLEEIAAEMRRLQNSCGGPINQRTAEISVRDDLLGLGVSVVDASTTTELSPAARFREILSQAAIPLDKRTRYTSTSSLGDLLRRPNGVLAATFRFSLDDFANLAATCNAKIIGIRTQLVGDVGSGQPTITILYDGVAQLRSCQPGIDDYVDAVAPGVTTLGSISTVRAPGRGTSPVPGLNEFPEGDFNRTLSGLPLASEYTLLIDTEIGENQNFDWDALEDVRLEIEYAYQDPFPAGQCE